MEGTGGECAEELSKTMGPVALSVLVASNELHSTKLGVMTDAFWQPGELMKACHQVQVGTPLIMDSAELQKVPPPHFAFELFAGGVFATGRWSCAWVSHLCVCLRLHLLVRLLQRVLGPLPLRLQLLTLLSLLLL